MFSSTIPWKSIDLWMVQIAQWSEYENPDYECVSFRFNGVRVLQIEGSITNPSDLQLEGYLLLYKQAQRDGLFCSDVSIPDAQLTTTPKTKTEFIKITENLDISGHIDTNPSDYCKYIVGSVNFVVATPPMARRFRDNDLTVSFGSLSYDLQFPENATSEPQPAGATTVNCIAGGQYGALTCEDDTETVLVPSTLEVVINVVVTNP